MADTRGGYDPVLFQTGIYRAWSNMKTRCLNTHVPDYVRWGGRGIRVCDRWLRFADFYADMGASYQDGFTLDRIDNDGDYNPTNCRWVSRTIQANNRRTNHLVTFRGETKTVAEWARLTGLKQSTIGMRLNVYGWPIERALTESVSIG